jgi:hypothetical protein
MRFIDGLQTLPPRGRTAKLGISDSSAIDRSDRWPTVKDFVRQILMKLGASNRTEVASLVRGQSDSGGADNGAGRATR